MGLITADSKRKPKRNSQHSQPTIFHTDSDARQDKTSKKINDRHHVNVSLTQWVRGRQKDHRVRTYAQHSQRNFIARVSHVAVSFHISLTPTTSSQSSPPPSHQQQPHYSNSNFNSNFNNNRPQQLLQPQQ